MLGQILFLLQNYFLGCSLDDKLKKYSWSRVFCRDLFLQNNFLGNTLDETFFSWKIFIVTKSFPRNKLGKKILVEIFLVQNFLLLQNHFLRNSLDKKGFLRKMFWLKIFYCCKIISSETVWMKKILVELFLVQNILLLQKHSLGNCSDEKFFWWKIVWSYIFIVAKLFPRMHFEW